MSRWGETRVVASNKNTDATVSESEMKKEKLGALRFAQA